MHANVIATVAEALVGDADAASPPWFGCVLRDGEVVAAAMNTMPGTAFVGPGPRDALAALAAALADTGRPIRSVAGERTAAEAFAAAWTALRGGRAEVAMAEAVHVLGRLRPPSGAPGAARALTAAEVPLAAQWFDDFTAEALPHLRRTPLDELRRRLAGGLDAGRLQLWHVDGEPMSMAMFRGPVHGTGRVGPVWTPPEHRRRGYAAAVTAACTQELLDRGATTCMLYTDLANPTSNGVYAGLGYERVGDAVDLALRD